ncbi:MAG: dockerin type I repeat-containing protein, partial [candidate division Zixibacteria bacterium]|nr:dockerin type I repeat-containing protein [candidate division Zixibacteria bacterium]
SAHDYHIHSSSPCAPANNECGVLMGALDIGCTETRCGDVNGNGMGITVGDLVYLIRYILGEAAPVTPWQNSDIDLCGNVNVADLALYIEAFVWGMMVPFCEGIPACYLPAGGNQITLGCPVQMMPPYPDSVAVPIYITNDTTLVALSLGFHYNSDDVVIRSLDTAGSVLPENWHIELSYPADTSYFWPVPDSNQVIIVAFAGISESFHYLEAQTGGLLTTIWLQIVPDAPAQEIDLDTTFIVPAGEFLFAVKGGGAIRPAYSDCNSADIILAALVCGDADGNGMVNVADVVYLIDYIFAGGPAPNPLLAGDVDCNAMVNIADVVYLINYIFGGGPEPCAGCP